MDADRPEWFSAERLAALLPPPAAIAAVGDALLDEGGDGAAPVRQRVRGASSLLLTMPAAARDRMGVKVLSVTEGNPGRGLATIQGVMLLFDGGDGHLLGLFDGPQLTRLRTAALAGWATDRLADPDAGRLAILGAGAQALPQVDAVCAVRPITKVTVWNRTPARAAQLAERVRARHPRLAVDVADDVRAAVATCDVVTLVTGARSPLLERRDLPARCHVNAMGAHEPEARELASDILAAAAVYADTVPGCLAEAGDLLIPIAEGRLERASVRPLATAATHPLPAALTVLKSVGAGSFDLACAAAAWRRAAPGAG